MPAKFTFSDPLSRTWLLIHQCHRLMSRMENRILHKVGLTTRKHAVLFALRNLPDPVTVTDVAHWLDRNPNGISMLVDRMVKDGFIKRTRDMDDRRSVRLVITKKGEKAIAGGNELTNQIFGEMFGSISDRKYNEVGNILAEVRSKSLDFLKLEYAKVGIEVLNGPSSKKKNSSSDEDLDEEETQ